MSSIKDYIRNIRTKYENWAVREDIASAFEYLVSAVTGLKHNSGAANLIEYPSGVTELNGIVFEPTDSGIHVYGTATEEVLIALDYGVKNMTSGKPYVASLGKNGTGTVYFRVAYHMDEGQISSAVIGSTESVMNFVCPSQYVSSRNAIYIPSGSTVDCVVNPRLRLANEEDPTQPETYTVEEISQKIHSGSIGGGNGYKIVTQASQMTDTDMIYVYMGSESGYSNGYWYYHNGTEWTAGAQFHLGRDGVDGVSPTVNVVAVTGGARVTVTDANGTTSVVLNDATNADLEARQDIADEIARAESAESGLDERVAALENSESTFEWVTKILNTTWGVTFEIKVCTGLGLFVLDMYGSWTSVPNTSGTFVSLGQDDVFKFATGHYSDHWKTHFQISKNYKAELYINEDGTVYFGQTAELATNNNIKVSKGGGVRAKYIWPLPSMLAPIET